MSTLDERVQRGVDWLDDEAQSSWFWEIDLNSLSFPALQTCVLGQLNLWTRFAERAGIGRVVAHYGFNLDAAAEDDPEFFEVDDAKVWRWTHLTNLWRAVIETKRANHEHT